MGRTFLLVLICVGSAHLALGDDAATQPAPAPTTRPARARKPKPVLPAKHADEILAMRLDADPATCALGRQYSLPHQILADLKDPDADVRQRAADTLKKAYFHEAKDSGGARIVYDQPDACRKILRPKEAAALLALHEYDLIHDLATEGVSDGNNAPDMDDAQAALVNMLLATGKFDDALLAAKTYYNICGLANTSKAIDLVSEALLNGPGRKDPSIVVRFKSEQAAGSQAPAGDPAASPSTGTSQSVLQSIVVDPTPYQKQLDELAEGLRNYNTLTRQGNLLLMQDKGADAVAIFQAAASITNDPKQLSAAIANVARAMRARDGCVGPANAYLLSLRQSTEPKS
jgi:tetratricopeptide (TPR) repeat protein